jgi:hypothetical protein
VLRVILGVVRAAVIGDVACDHSVEELPFGIRKIRELFCGAREQRVVLGSHENPSCTNCHTSASGSENNWQQSSSALPSVAAAV